MKAVFLLSIVLLSSHYASMGQSGSLLTAFPLSTPEKQGLSSGTLDSMLGFIKETNQNIHHLTIIRNDRTVLDTDIYPYSSHDLHDVASVTKSITALLIGIAIDKGFIRNEDQRVLPFFPEIAAYDTALRSLTIKHLVTMTSGFACGVADGEKALSNMRKSKDWVQFIFSLPVVAPPGRTFSYCSCNFYLLGEIIHRATHLTPNDFARKYLFAPLQVTGSKWLSNYKNINHGWGDLFLHPVDMAKIGRLMLDKGRWQHRQIISQDWVSKCLRTYSKINEEKGYGYGWWTYDKGGFYEAAGRGRQTISIIPSRNMIVIMTGGEFDAGTIGRFIFQSIRDDQALPENKQAYTWLSGSLRQIAAGPIIEARVVIIDTLLRTLNGKSIIFEKNITDIDSLRLTFHSKYEGAVIFYRGRTKDEHPFVFSENTYAISKDPVLQLPVALQAECNTPDELILHYNQLCRINNFYFLFAVSGGKVVTTLQETTNDIKMNIASVLK